MHLTIKQVKSSDDWWKSFLILALSNRKSSGKRNLIVHNVGGGQVLEDCLFSYEIVGHLDSKEVNFCETSNCFDYVV
jgi:hypothetical protein